MSSTAGNIDFIVPDNNIGIPSCSHGPALLFRKYVLGDKSKRKFFACAAFRDRKQCRFFRWADDKSARSSVPQESFQQLGFSPEQLRERFEKFWGLEEGERRFCSTCGLVLLPSEDGHSGHRLVSPVSVGRLNQPTSLFSPLEDNKTYAQYLFSKESVDFVLSTLRKNKITHALCIGLPRVHEALTQVSSGKNTSGMRSLLMDLDQRYMQVYPPHSFCHYNMFNHHFFGGPESQAVFEQFLADSGKGSSSGEELARVAVLMDPPFGGMVEPLCLTLEKIRQAWTRACQPPGAAQKLSILWFFPYFMEPRMVSSLPELNMLDYKVEYTNHLLFTGTKTGRKKGSPVRIFTNLPPASVPLSAGEGYWWCDVCNRYSAPENKHCSQCNSCTSKDGSTYVHCALCGTCVKPSWSHCATCGRCDLANHQCNRQPSGCHVCGQVGHKRKDCPQVKIKLSRKRKNKARATAAGPFKRKKAK